MITLQELIGHWNSFFFEPIPVHTVALFRIIFGLLLLRDACYTLANLKDYLGPNGLIQYDRYTRRNPRILSLFLYLPGTIQSVYIIMAIHIISLVFMIVGLFTPISIFVFFVTLRSIVNRNPGIHNGGDNVSRIMCFLLIFASAGHTYSLDEYLFYAPNDPTKEYLQQAPWALRLMQIQLAIIYIKSAYWKLKGTTYRDGTAVYYSLQNYMYSRFPMPAFMQRKPFVHIMTWSTLLIEFLLGITVWIKEFRVTTIIVGITFHLLLEYAMNVHLFGWFMIVCWLLFLDPNWVISMMGGQLP